MAASGISGWNPTLAGMLTHITAPPRQFSVTESSGKLPPDSGTAMPDTQLHRSACPKCQTKMTLSSVSQGPVGFDHQTFECQGCDHAEQVVVALDAMKPNTVGWL